eukprot:scaffold17676_cov45-Phaeocystis_antarctica.AAC.1
MLWREGGLHGLHGGARRPLEHVALVVHAREQLRQQSLHDLVGSVREVREQRAHSLERRLHYLVVRVGQPLEQHGAHPVEQGQQLGASVRAHQHRQLGAAARARRPDLRARLGQDARGVHQRQRRHARLLLPERRHYRAGRAA